MLPDLAAALGLLTSADCLRCEVCCRFPDATSPLAPFFSEAEARKAREAGTDGEAFPPGSYGPGHPILLSPSASLYRCPAFRPDRNDCAMYAARPLDCRLYPFMLMYDAPGQSVSLGVDAYCPVLAERRNRPEFARCADELAALLDGPMAREVIANAGVVTPWKDHIAPLRPMPCLTRALCRSDLGLARLTPAARPSLEPFFAAHKGSLSYHAFASIVLWSGIFDLRWKVADRRLLVYASGEGDAFLLAPPIGEGDILGPAREAVRALRHMAPDAPSPRIQECDDATARSLAAAGFRVRESAVEYVYDRAEMAALKGNRFEKKRQMCNRFERDHRWTWRAFRSDDLPGALSLYRKWLGRVTAKYPDVFHTAQAEASFRTFYRALCLHEELGLTARVLFAEGGMAGVTVACPLPDGETVYDMFEITDPEARGAAQFLFRELCRELTAFRHINAGSASGLPDVERVKESYRPALRLPVHTLVPVKGT